MNTKTFEAIEKLKEVELELHRLKNALEMANKALDAQRTWVGLSDEEKQEWIDAMPYDPEPRHCMILVNVIEAKLKEKNT